MQYGALWCLDCMQVTFKLREPGFLRVYEGTWTMKPIYLPTPSPPAIVAVAPAGKLSRSGSLGLSRSGSSSLSRSGSGTLFGAGPLAAMTEAAQLAQLGNPLEAMQQKLQSFDLSGARAEHGGRVVCGS
jgi:hypothetical protein